jgi:para-nitrobenzyl esterase
VSTDDGPSRETGGVTSPTPGPLAETRTGTVRGVARRDGSLAFLGIPYAQAPTGALRFAAPVPPAPWEGVRDVTRHGATPQRVEDPHSLIPEPSVPGDETLTASVFAGDLGGRLPVLVWIHGGGYIGGSPASPWYDGAAFVRDGVVLVTLSYRLGFDGFGEIEGAPGNRAVRDWIAGLEWVRDNIAAFGGDPGRVTIGGQSAGGGAVLTLLAMPAAQHLFHAVWAASPALGDVPATAAVARTERLAALVDVHPTRAGFASVPEERLRRHQDEAARTPSLDRLAPMREMLAEGGRAWAPVVDGELLPQPVLAALASGIGADKPLVVGATDDEFTMLTDRAKGVLRLVPPAVALRALGLRHPGAYLRANGPQRRKGTAAVLGRYVTDRVFRATVAAAAAAHAPSWVYRFAWVSPTFGWSCHCLDVPFLFDVLDGPRVDRLAGDAPPQALADALHASIVAFVRDGAPPWPRFDPSRATVRAFGAPTGEPDLQREAYAGTAPLRV